MNQTQVLYRGYSIDIPDGLIKPFKLLAFLLKHLEFESIFDLMNNNATLDLLAKCANATIAAIGQNFAHDTRVGAALDGWLSMSEVEQVIELVKAARMTEPSDFSHIFQNSSDHNAS